MRSARFSVAFVRDLFHFLSSRGLDTSTLCAGIGLDPAELENPDEMMAGPVAAAAWRAAATASGDAELGLHLGEQVHPSQLGLLGFAMLSCETLDAALERLRRHWNLLSNATEIHFWRDASRAGLELRLLDLPGNFLREDRHPAESSLAAVLAMVRALTGRVLEPQAVTLLYAAPTRSAEYVRILGRMPEFAAPVNGVVFSAAALAWPVRQANAQLLAGLERELAMRTAAQPAALADQVRAELARRLRGELPALAEVARALHMSPRALQRGLEGDGLSFRQVLDELRRDLACEHLRDPRHSIADVSFLLGFSEPSAFHRFFRKWTGETPAAYRAAR